MFPSERSPPQPQHLAPSTTSISPRFQHTHTAIKLAGGLYPSLHCVGKFNAGILLVAVDQRPAILVIRFHAVKLKPFTHGSKPLFSKNLALRFRSRFAANVISPTTSTTLGYPNMITRSRAPASRTSLSTSTAPTRLSSGNTCSEAPSR